MKTITPDMLETSVLEASFTLGKSIVAMRKARKFSQRDLAAESGVGRSTIVEIENGSPKVQLVHYLKVMNALGMLSTINQLSASNIALIADSVRPR